MSLNLPPIRYYRTAYDSRHPRDLPDDQREHGFNARLLRKHPVPNIGQQCREYLFDRYSVSNVRHYNGKSIEQIENDLAAEYNGTLQFIWPSQRNPAVYLDQVTAFLGIASFAAIITILMIGFATTFSINGIANDTLLFSPVFILYFIGKSALNRGWIKDKNNTVFDRGTGMVTLYSKKNGRVDLPFDEFDPYLSIGTSPTGSSNIYLRLFHRYQGYAPTNAGHFNNPIDAYQYWETLQRFMDVAQPLPDIPEFDSMRLIDPVTIEHDKKVGRPDHYWKTVSVEQVEEWHDASYKACHSFPWGSTREHALKYGWKPSGVAEGDWTRIHNVDEETLTPTPVTEGEAL